MFQNTFMLVGKIEKIEMHPQYVRYILSPAAPIKHRCSAEIRNPELRAVVTSPNGFKVGDTISLTGMIVLDEKTGGNVCVVSKDGASRIASAPGQVAPPAKGAPALTSALGRPALAVAAPAMPAPAAVTSGLSAKSTIVASDDDEAGDSDADDAKPKTPSPTIVRTAINSGPLGADVTDWSEADIPF